MKVLLRIPLSKYSGYGNDGIGLAQAFIRRGADVYLQPTHVDAPLPPEVAALLMKEVKGPFDLYINHVDPALLTLPDEVAEHVDVSVAWTMWEYTNYENGSKKKSLRKRLKNFDLFAGYSSIDVDTFREYFDGPVIVQQGGYNAEDWPVMEDRDWNSREFHMAMVGVLSERKDPWVAIRAYEKACAADPEFKRWARLSLKTVAPGLHHKIEDLYRYEDEETGEKWSGLRIWYDIWPVELLREFYRVQHLLLAPSRGEGKNMPALEFMSTGGTVVATDWAGHAQWLSPDYAYPLSYELQPVSHDHPTTLNARASVEHLAEIMLHAFHNRQEVRQKGQVASQVIPALSDWDKVVQRLMEKIRDNVPEKGQRLWTIDQISQRDVRYANG